MSLTNLTFMKPIFTNYGQSLTETLPDCCGPLARCLSRSPEPKVQQVWLCWLISYLTSFLNLKEFKILLCFSKMQHVCSFIKYNRCWLVFFFFTLLSSDLNVRPEHSDLLITSMIIDWIGWHDVLLPIRQNYDKIRERKQTSFIKKNSC